MADRQLDLRGKVPGERGELARAAFESLASGEELGIVSDIDPHPIYHELKADFPVDDDRSEIRAREDDLFTAWFVRE